MRAPLILADLECRIWTESTRRCLSRFCYDGARVNALAFHRMYSNYCCLACEASELTFLSFWRALDGKDACGRLRRRPGESLDTESSRRPLLCCKELQFFLVANYLGHFND